MVQKWAGWPHGPCRQGGGGGPGRFGAEDKISSGPQLGTVAVQGPQCFRAHIPGLSLLLCAAKRVVGCLVLFVEAAGADRRVKSLTFRATRGAEGCLRAWWGPIWGLFYGGLGGHLSWDMDRRFFLIALGR